MSNVFEVRMMKQRMVAAVIIAVFCLGIFPAFSGAGLFDALESVVKDTVAPKGAASALSEADISAGLKEALAKAVDKAVSGLGREGGYLSNPLVKIPMPEGLGMAEKGLRMVGQGALADEFVMSMNRAAEQAVVEARTVFMTALKGMTLQDARSILDGPDNAATQFFERTTRDDLRQRFLPLVEQATDSVGVTRSYKPMMDKAAVAAQAAGFEESDLDEYVTGKGLDGLFVMMANEEKEIRTNPVARTTELLEKVFGQ